MSDSTSQRPNARPRPDETWKDYMKRMQPYIKLPPPVKKKPAPRRRGETA